ncbi:MAG: HNH endonuclease, partial [Gallionella sp.]|nr:HNH endonuclease [Gallionella sp.]
MRPIDKGADRGAFSKYQDAQKLLIEQLGEYCSYCERWLATSIAVEHKKPKQKHPEDEFLWHNFLLSCANCNSTKQGDEINLDEFIWPDADNTFRAFIYDEEGRVIPKQDFSDAKINQQIYATWQMLGLNRHEDVYSLPIRLVHPLFASGYMQKGEDDNPTGHRIARDKLVQLHSRRY